MSFIIMVASLAFTHSSPALDGLTFCRFGPKVKVIPGHMKESKKCVATAKIQAIAWECVKESEVSDTTRMFSKSLENTGRKECQKFCSARGKNCLGVYRQAPGCALSIDSRQALEAGTKLGCRKKCTGQAMAYCSLYNTGYTSDATEMMEDEPPNCQCVEKKASGA